MSINTTTGPLTEPTLIALPRAPYSTLPWKELVVVGIVMLAAYAGILIRLVGQYLNDANFSHGFIVPFFSAFVVWTKRKELESLPLNPSWWGLPIVLAALMAMIVGSLGSELFSTRSSFVVLLAGVIVLFLGMDWLKALSFPVAMLFLMVPIPAIVFNRITFPLQLLASNLSASILPLLGVPVLREGNIIQLPATPLGVEEACSGIRSLLSLGTLSIIYAYMTEQRLLWRVVITLASVPIALGANAIRIVITGLMVQYWDVDKAMGFFHEFSGWVIFMVSLGFLFGLTKIIHFRGFASKSGVA